MKSFISGQFVKIIPTGQYTVTVSKEGLETQVHDVYVPEATPLNVLWVLQLSQGNQSQPIVTQPATTTIPSTDSPDIPASSTALSSHAPDTSHAVPAKTSVAPTTQQATHAPTTTLPIAVSAQAYSGSIFGWFLVILVVVS